MQSTTIAITNVAMTFMVYHKNNACETVPLGTNSLSSTRYGCLATDSSTLPSAITVATWPAPSTALALTVSATVLFGDGVENGSVSYLITTQASSNFKAFAASVGTALTITATNGSKDTSSVLKCMNN